MSRFKGTKGKWLHSWNGIYWEILRIEDHKDGRALSVDLMLFESFPDQKTVKEIHDSDECKANALLISKAPEMLEMLEKLVNVWDFINDKKHHNPDIEEARQLIKEATTL